MTKRLGLATGAMTPGLVALSTLIAVSTETTVLFCGFGRPAKTRSKNAPSMGTPKPLHEQSSQERRGAHTLKESRVRAQVAKGAHGTKTEAAIAVTPVGGTLAITTLNVMIVSSQCSSSR